LQGQVVYHNYICSPLCHHPSHPGKCWV